MIYIWCLIYVLAILLCGGAAVVLILGSNRRSSLEVLGLVISLGAGVAGTVLIWFSILGLKPSRMSIVLLGVCAAACVMLSGMTRGWPRLARPVFRRPVWRNLLILLPLVLIAVAVLLVAMISLRFDLFEGDSIVIWGFKAKVLFLAPLSSRPPAFTDPMFSYTHQDYPMLVPMLIAAAYAMLGQVNEQAGKVILPLLYASQAMLGFTAVRRWLSPARALFVTAMLICVPFGVFFAGTGNPDAVLETFYLGSLVYLVRWIEESSRDDLMLSMVFCAFCAMTKQEGLALALIQMAVLPVFILIQRNRLASWTDYAWSVVVLAIGAGSWWIWRINLPHTVNLYTARFRLSIVIDNLGRLGIIIPTLARETIAFSRWGALWLLVPVSAIMGYKAFFKPEAWVLWTLFLLHVGLYLVAYVVADWDLVRLLSVSSSRLVLHLAPAAMLLISLHWSVVRPMPPPLPSHDSSPSSEATNPA